VASKSSATIFILRVIFRVSPCSYYLSKLNLIIFIFRVFVAKVLLPPSQNGVKDEADRQ